MFRLLSIMSLPLAPGLPPYDSRFSASHPAVLIMFNGHCGLQPMTLQRHWTVYVSALYASSHADAYRSCDNTPVAQMSSNSAKIAQLAIAASGEAHDGRSSFETLLEMEVVSRPGCGMLLPLTSSHAGCLPDAAALDSTVGDH